MNHKRIWNLRFSLNRVQLSANHCVHWETSCLVSLNSFWCSMSQWLFSPGDFELLRLVWTKCLGRTTKGWRRLRVGSPLPLFLPFPFTSRTTYVFDAQVTSLIPSFSFFHQSKRADVFAVRTLQTR